MKTRSSATERFTAKVNVVEAGCHMWTAGLDHEGYGKFWFEGRMQMAHRVAWFLEHGSVPPELDHNCRTRACVNVEHLEDVTHSENLKRGDMSRVQRPDPSKCQKGLHDWIPANISMTNGGGKPTCRPCKNDRMREYRR